MTHPRSKSTRARHIGRLVAAVGVALAAVCLAAVSGAFAANMTAINVDHGGSATNFQLVLPIGASCSHDTQSGNYKLYSYVVDNARVPASSISTLNFSSGAANTGGALIDSSGVPYEQIATNPQSADVPTPPAFSWAPYAEGDFGTGLDLYPGVFNVGIACALPSGAVDGDHFWNVQIRFTSRTTDPGHFTWALAPFATATALSASPAGPLGPGATVTLTATLSPASAPGTVDFFDGTTRLNSTPEPVVVNSGTASASFGTGSLAVGSHSLSAVYTPTAYTGTNPLVDVYTGSQSAALTYVISTGSTSTTLAPGATTTIIGNGSTTTSAPGSSGSSSTLGSGGPSGSGSGGAGTGTGSTGGGASGLPGSTGSGAGDGAASTGVPGASSAAAGGGAARGSTVNVGRSARGSATIGRGNVSVKAIRATGSTTTRNLILALLAGAAVLFALSFLVPTHPRQSATTGPVIT